MIARSPSFQRTVSNTRCWGWARCTSACRIARCRRHSLVSQDFENCATCLAPLHRASSTLPIPRATVALSITTVAADIPWSVTTRLPDRAPQAKWSAGRLAGDPAHRCGRHTPRPDRTPLPSSCSPAARPKLPKAVINTQRMLCANQQQMRQSMPVLADADNPPVLVDWLP